MLLKDLIDLSADDKQPITTLLRKCIILAHQLKNDRLKTWANEELNGYDTNESLPKYRVVPAAATGLFVGIGWARMQQGIPSFALKKEHRDFAEKVFIGQPVGAIEDSIKSGSSSGLNYPWNANLVAHYQDNLMSDWQLHSAYQSVPKSVLAGILDTVRTRVLNMALEIQSDVGERDEDLKEITPEESKKVDQTIVNNIYGGNVFLSAGQSTMTATSVQQNIVAGDWEHLAKVLQGAGISEPELAELSKANEADGKTMGAKVKGWIQKAAPQVLSGGVKVGVEVGKSLLLEYLKQYYGLPS